jgi:hypothetical protein
MTLPRTIDQSAADHVTVESVATLGAGVKQRAQGPSPGPTLLVIGSLAADRIFT